MILLGPVSRMHNACGQRVWGWPYYFYMKILIVTTCCVMAFASVILGSCMAWNDKPLWGVFVFVGIALIGIACTAHKEL